MTAKEYLSQAKRMDGIINCRLRELDYWKDLSRRVSGGGFERSYCPNCPTEAPFARCLEKIDEIERDIDSRIDGLVDLRDKINRAIDALGNREEQAVLRCRYLDGFDWEEISRILSVSVRTVYRIHGTALQNFKVPD